MVILVKSSLKNIMLKLLKKKGDTGANLVGILESRLDAVLYRMKLAPTVFACRQLINHGHVLVNDKRCNIPSRMLTSDKITLKEKARTIPAVMEAISSTERDVPDYIEADHSKFSGGL